MSSNKEEIVFYKSILDTFVEDTKQEKYLFPSNLSSRTQRKLMKYAVQIGLNTEVCATGKPFKNSKIKIVIDHKIKIVIDHSLFYIFVQAKIVILLY